eukprot:TRINITY_DN4093_c0_g1_i2.p1 TRINITY_DN4093_c0_g1~~TRINITY_DN4093_c0_g1_i2.p1  ORF type:complete len:360 (-),score=95.71 TRINITY_DN4093_c0_g1_i2:207-1187(-)
MARIRSSTLLSAVTFVAVVVAAALGASPAVGATVAPRGPAPTGVDAPRATLRAGVHRAAGVSLPAPVARGFFSNVWKSTKKGVRNVVDAIIKPIRAGVKAISRPFEQAAKAIADAVKAVGRAAKRAVKDAGKALDKAGKAVKQWVKERTEAVTRIFGKSKKEAERLKREAEAVAAATALAAKESGAGKTFDGLNTLVNDIKGRMQNATENALEEADVLREDVEKAAKRGLSRSVRRRLTTAKDYGAADLGKAKQVADEVRELLQTIQGIVESLVDEAKNHPESAPLQEVAKDAELALASTIEDEGNLAGAVESLTSSVVAAEELLG